MKVVYTRRYNIGFLGIERLHPFDSRKYGRAWKVIGEEAPKFRDRDWVEVQQPASVADLEAIHDPAYLKRLRRSREQAAALELPFLRLLPGWLVWRAVVRPMLWGVAGSLLAAREALDNGVAVNLSRGYHHAKPDRGEGFCLFNDIAYLVHALRAEKRLTSADRIAYIDLDVHQGNGVCHHFRDDRRVFIYDTFNPRIYPLYDREARDRIDCTMPLPQHCTGMEYLRLLDRSLPGFLDSISRNERVGLAIYNAGTDVFEGDRLGHVRLSAADVLARDLFVIEQVRSRGIPVMMLLSGGYSRESYRLVANTVVELLRKYS